MRDSWGRLPLAIKALIVCWTIAFPGVATWYVAVTTLHGPVTPKSLNLSVQGVYSDEINGFGDSCRRIAINTWGCDASDSSSSGSTSYRVVVVPNSSNWTASRVNTKWAAVGPIRLRGHVSLAQRHTALLPVSNALISGSSDGDWLLALIGILGWLGLVFIPLAWSAIDRLVRQASRHTLRSIGPAPESPTRRDTDS